MSRIVRLGIFILGTLTILGVAIFLIGDRRFLFSSNYTLKAPFDNVGGLPNGAEVRVGGIHEGTVEQIQLPTQPGGKVIVVIELQKSTRDIVKKDSVASIKTEGLVGDKFVEVSFGSNDAPKVNDGDTIASQPPLDISDVLTKTNQILDSSKDAVNNLQSITSKIDKGKGTAGAFVNDKKMYDQMSAAANQAQAGATAFQENMEALKHNFFLRGFFNRRGYNDSSQLTAHQIDSLPQQPYIKKFAYDAKQIFAKPDTAKLKSPKRLDDAGQFLRQNKFGTAVVVAYAGSKGDSEKGQSLAQARAMVVRDYLVKNFAMDDTCLKTIALGKSPQNETVEDGRVEVLIYAEESEPPTAKNQEISGLR
jgi:phospholipid/cholesterol/gamma-HCH transport system substrate-binding protein